MRERSVTHLRRDEGMLGRRTGGSLTYKVTAEQTSGAYSLFGEIFRPGEGGAPHIHHREDECFYVVEGQVEFRLDEGAVVASPGSLIYVPRESVHAFTNKGEAPARILDLPTPNGTRERLLEEIGDENTSDLRRIYARYGVELVDAPTPQREAADDHHPCQRGRSRGTETVPG